MKVQIDTNGIGVKSGLAMRQRLLAAIARRRREARALMLAQRRDSRGTAALQSSARADDTTPRGQR